MERAQGSYALVQYSPAPERMEFLNVGVMLAVPDRRFLRVRFAGVQSRVERYFGSHRKAYVQKLKESFSARLEADFGDRFNMSALEVFASRRANELRISPFLPVALADPAETLERLFRELVGEDELARRQPRMARRLREAFVSARIDDLLEKNPAVVDLPEAGIQVRAPFGYQNGAYNLIDGMRFGEDRSVAMREAGKRALEGDLLWKHSEKSGDLMRSVVVADFGAQPAAFYEAVGEQLEESHVRLYRFDNLGPLVEDIRQHAHQHSR